MAQNRLFIRSVLFSVSFACLLLLLLVAIPARPTRAEVTLLIPSRPDITTPEKKEGTRQSQKASDKKEKTSSADPVKPDQPERIKEEVDILITRMNAFGNTCFSMDRPQSFSVLLFNKNTPKKNGRNQPKRLDLLQDVEEILYKDQKAWGANVAIHEPGLYQFLLETKPWWDDAQQNFVQHSIKVMLPVYGDDTGWEEATGSRFEIVPLTRPFGLLAPTIFRGTVLFDSKPQANCLVVIERINTDGQRVPTPWHESQVLRTDTNGHFSTILNKSGWWCCQALINDAPLKGADGEPKALNLGALYWFFVDESDLTK